MYDSPITASSERLPPLGISTRSCARWALLAAALVLGCQPAEPGEGAQLTRDGAIDAAPELTRDGSGAEPEASEPVDLDQDQDGLCDDSEQAAGTDPQKPDTDGDGIPDMNEIRAGFAALDPGSPGLDRLVHLTEESDSWVQLLVHIWVEGQGESYTGVLEDADAVAASGLSAAALVGEVTAVAAEPEDHAFEIEPEYARFGAVQGSTRLTFAISFTFADQQPAGCTRALPFSFGVKRPDGAGTTGDRYYLLVVVPPSVDSEEPSWCRPERCY